MSSGQALPKKERLLKYKTFAVGFSYPDNDFFNFFSHLLSVKENLSYEYDRLFRNNELWLYTLEYVVENEFQRVQGLADINGFYRAFGLETDKDRPDALPCELEFMHYLIFKEINAVDEEKTFICRSAQKKFFNLYLYPTAKKIAELVISQTRNNFYIEIAEDLLIFLESEKEALI